jgi:hypothetical protein
VFLLTTHTGTLHRGGRAGGRLAYDGSKPTARYSLLSALDKLTMFFLL